jgi:MoaA/NifB/PqqE/SkfB family radical SAM enzyme
MGALKKFEIDLVYHFSEILEYPFVNPYWIYISLSHRCTYNCQMCGVVKILKGQELPAEIIKRSFNEISQWNNDRVVVFTGGEPFLRRDIFELINNAVKQGIKIEAVSNGSLIDETLAEKIISSGLQNIAVSLDGACQETHDFIRQAGAFRKALNAIRCLSAAKKRAGSGPQISVWTTIMKENVRELFDIAPLVKDLGVECLVYHPVIVAQDDMQNTSPEAPFWIRDSDTEELDRQIEKILDYKKQNGLIVFLHDPKLWVSHFKGEVTKKEWKCNPFVFINIGPDGEVRSCGASFGNIKDMSLKDCFITREAFQARRLMSSCQKPCLQTCWAHPESDSLLKITGNFIDRIKDSPDKAGFIKQALRLLDKFEDLVKEHKYA